jgi:hypothetical protein
VTDLRRIAGKLRRLIPAAAVALAILLSVGAAAHAFEDRVRKPNYKGQGTFDRSMKVGFRVHRAGGHAVVDFQARHIKLFCQDGSERRFTATVIRSPMNDDGRGFNRLVYFSDDSEAIYWFRGVLTSSGTLAKGEVLLTLNGPDDARDCSSGGKRSWKAQRVP